MMIAATTVRTALITYRGELLSLATKYPDQFKDCDATINRIDDSTSAARSYRLQDAIAQLRELINEQEQTNEED